MLLHNYKIEMVICHIYNSKIEIEQNLLLTMQKSKV